MSVPGWVDACQAAFARRLAEPDRFAALEVPRVDLRATPDGRALYEAFGFRELGGATMAWTAAGTPAPGLGFVRAD